MTAVTYSNLTTRNAVAWDAVPVIGLIRIKLGRMPPFMMVHDFIPPILSYLWYCSLRSGFDIIDLYIIVPPCASQPPSLSLALYSPWQNMRPGNLPGHGKRRSEGSHGKRRSEGRWGFLRAKSSTENIKHLINDRHFDKCMPKSFICSFREWSKILVRLDSILRIKPRKSFNPGSLAICFFLKELPDFSIILWSAIRMCNQRIVCWHFFKAGCRCWRFYRKSIINTGSVVRLQPWQICTGLFHSSSSIVNR